MNVGIDTDTGIATIVSKRKPLLILGCALLLVACEASRPPFTLDNERYGGAVDRRADSPGTLISKRAADVYELEYFRALDHKAIAQSRNGTWSWVHDQVSPEAAMDEALAKCRKLNDADEFSEPCQVVNVNGFWIAEFANRR